MNIEYVYEREINKLPKKISLKKTRTFNII